MPRRGCRQTLRQVMLTPGPVRLTVSSHYDFVLESKVARLSHILDLNDNASPIFDTDEEGSPPEKLGKMPRNDDWTSVVLQVNSADVPQVLSKCRQ